MLKVILPVWILLVCLNIISGFEFPDVKLEAFDPTGFRASIPKIEGVRLFAFHGNKNKRLSSIEPGEFHMDIINPEKNGWSYYLPDLQLKEGDKIYYWVFIQHGDFRYKKDNLVWDVKLSASQPGNKSSDTTPCVYSQTEVLGPMKICKEQLIFDSAFHAKTALSGNLWKQAHYIPSFPDFEFCSYQKRSDVISVKDNKLVIKPFASIVESEVRGQLDLRNGCTSHFEINCFAYDNSGFILPPVISGKMKTNNNFKYGTVEVRAKLPAGDWLYPEIYLESSSTPQRKIFIAYSRGNKNLVGNAGDDIGGTLLFGGPVIYTNEPNRSKYLVSKKSQEAYSSGFHNYSVVWEPTKISFLVDGVQYGDIKNEVVSVFSEPMHVVLGVGVGGDTDFPDGYVSTNSKKKPWQNYERLQFRKFFDARNDWLPTWTDEGSPLIVEHVKIFAL